MTHNGTCMNKKGKKHFIVWKAKEPYFEDDMVHFDGICINCRTEFQKSFQETGLTIISKHGRETNNFNKEVDELFV
jgi:hypothetical protein